MTMFLFGLFSLVTLSHSAYVRIYETVGGYPTYSIGEHDFNTLFQLNAPHIIKRVCGGCTSSHQQIWYRRFTDTDNYGPFSDFTVYWTNNNNAFHTDFELYSFESDALANTNAWTVCNFNGAAGIAFPLDCGPSSYAAFQFNYGDPTLFSGGQYAVTFYLYVEDFLVTLTRDNSGNIKQIYGHLFNVIFQDSNDHIIKRNCPNCISSHQNIYYKRLTDLTTFNPYFYITDDWSSTNNIRDDDFNLYSSLSDALSNTDKWTYCNFDDYGVGFPRDCGPSGFIGGQWNAWSCARNDFPVPCGEIEITFSIYIS